MDLSLFLNKRQAKDLARRILVVTLGSNRGTAAPACFDRNLATIQPIIMLDSRKKGLRELLVHGTQSLKMPARCVLLSTTIHEKRVQAIQRERR